MDRKTLRKVQLTQLEILKEVDRICTKHGIKYWLSGGTQLGAVRHNGFIPWDDDLDIDMMREDFNRFLKIARTELKKSYYLQDWFTEKAYGLPFAKIRKNNTLFVEAGSQHSKSHHGIYVDIFAFDSFPEDEKELKEVSFYMNYVYRVILAGCGYTPWYNGQGFSLKRWVIYLPIRLIAAVSNVQKLKEKYIKTVTKANGEKTGRVFNSCEPGDEKMPFDRGVVSRLERHTFEDGKFPVPVDYDTYLTTVYGDYMQLPPVDQRENRHNIIKLKL